MDPLPRRRPPRTPPGCEGYLTRQQVAALLGFPSEFKVRQLERDGRLRSVRGPMRTAFYARAEVLAIKAELDQESPWADNDWTDAELLVLLRNPHREGRTRTALDLVLETQISIERAEKVYAFWVSSGGATVAMPEPPKPAVQVREEAPAAPVRAQIADHIPEPIRPPERIPHPIEVARQPQITARLEHDQASDERRGEERLSRDALIHELRHPDPRVRERAFARLREGQSGA